MGTYPRFKSDEELLEIARQWPDDGADGETVWALTREVIRLRGVNEDVCRSREKSLESLREATQAREQTERIMNEIAPRCRECAHFDGGCLSGVRLLCQHQKYTG